MGTPAFIIPLMKKISPLLTLTQQWVVATGETNTTIINALNTFETTLNTNSLSVLKRFNFVQMKK